MKFIIYTDGACSGNKRDSGCPGGWAYIILDSSETLINGGSGKGSNTTNNKMELLAVIKSLEALILILKNYWGGSQKHDCEVRSDSKYIVDNFYENLSYWKMNNWRKSNGGQVLNKSYWMSIDKLTPKFKSLIFTWVKAHNTDKHNILVDAMAKRNS